MLRQVLLWASENAWMERQMRRRAFARRAVSRFMPGETAEAALDAAGGLGEHDISTVFTKLGEALTDRDEIEGVVQHYESLLERITTRKLSSQISIKLTQLGQDLGQEVAQANLERLAAAAAEQGNVVWVDMEASPYVDETLEIFTATLARYPNLGLCVQAYLYRTAADVTRLLGLGARLRLVKGAYQEPADIAWPRKPDVDENFMVLTRLMLEGANPAAPHGLATHDTVLLGRILEEAREMGLPPDAFEVQMLYGIRAREQLALRRRGIPVRVLISYGPHWYPWYMRRLAERPANLGFVVRSVFAR